MGKDLIFNACTSWYFGQMKFRFFALHAETLNREGQKKKLKLSGTERSDKKRDEILSFMKHMRR